MSRKYKYHYQIIEESKNTKEETCIYFRCFDSRNVQVLTLIVESICRSRVVCLSDISLPWEKSGIASQRQKHDMYRW